MRDPQLFLLRVWSDGPFRAALRALDEREPVLFTTPAQLTAYLASRGRCLDPQSPGEEDETPLA